MSQQAVAIVIAGALIAAAIMLTNHWAVGAYGPGPLVRMNRWTGTAFICRPETGYEMSCPPR
jgi:hypothetical protein